MRSAGDLESVPGDGRVCMRACVRACVIPKKRCQGQQQIFHAHKQKENYSSSNWSVCVFVCVCACVRARVLYYLLENR